MDTKFPMPNTLEERQASVQSKMEKLMPPDTLESFRRDIGTDVIKFLALSGLMKRDLWDEFWGVYRDTIEKETDNLLSKIDEGASSKRGLFG